MFESCHSTWLFDAERMRFQRILKAGAGKVATEWRTYHALIADPASESFTVVLNPEGSRLLRSWRHTRDCVQCGEHVTTELAVGELAGATDRRRTA